MKSKILGFFVLFFLGFGVMSAYLYLKPQHTTYDLCGKTPQGKVCVIYAAYSSPQPQIGLIIT